MRIRVLVAAICLAGCGDHGQAQDDWLTSSRKQLAQHAKDIDLDGDGYAELHVQEYFPDGSPKRESFDFDENGTDDAWLTWDDDRSGTLYVEDSDHDGVPDSSRRAASYADGYQTLVQVLDTDRDHKLDTRITTSWYEQANVITTTTELYINGRFWLVDTTSGPRDDAFADFTGPGGTVAVDSACASQEQELSAAYQDVINEGRDCLAKIDEKLGARFAAEMASHPATQFTCNPENPDYCATATYGGLAVPNPNTLLLINFNPAANPRCSNYPATVTMFHELLHYYFGPHLKGTGVDDPADPMFKCASYCFGAGGAEDCEACIGLSAGTAIDGCPNSSGTFVCNGQTYPSTVPNSNIKQYCGTCNGQKMVMSEFETCCGGAVKCKWDEVCGKCGDTPYCTSGADRLTCKECNGNLQVTTIDDHCCPPDNPDWDPALMQCKASCPGGTTAGGDAPVVRNFDLGRTSGSFVFNWDTFVVKDRILVTYQGDILYDTGCVGASDTVLLDYSGTDTFVTISV